jgi:hypothetical protein
MPVELDGRGEGGLSKWKYGGRGRVDEPQRKLELCWSRGKICLEVSRSEDMWKDSGVNSSNAEEIWILCSATVPAVGIEEGEICILGWMVFWREAGPKQGREDSKMGWGQEIGESAIS